MVESLNWVDNELGGLNLNDIRLNNKCTDILKAMFSSPTKSINASFDGWDETKAAYRFFDNSKVTPEKILHPHYKKTIERMDKRKIILFVQDTSDINFSK